MRIGALVDISATLEPWIAVGAGAALVVLVANRVFADHSPGSRPSLDAAIAPGTERGLLLALVAFGLLIRVVGWDSALTPVFWFSEFPSLIVDDWVRTGKLWEVWLRK